MAKNSGLASRFRREQQNPLDAYETEEWSLLRQALEGASSYLEFGCGLSTEFVSKSYGCTARSIETSYEWVARVQKRVGDEVQIIHVDLGEVGRWGRPLTYQNRKNFIRYFEAGFDNGFSPDAVLIDGRFRVACFLTTLLLSRPGTRIVVDDYPDRPHYKVIEEIVAPTSTSSRQALFVVPGSINYKVTRELRDQFTNVME